MIKRSILLALFLAGLMGCREEYVERKQMSYCATTNARIVLSKIFLECVATSPGSLQVQQCEQTATKIICPLRDFCRDVWYEFSPPKFGIQYGEWELCEEPRAHTY